MAAPDQARPAATVTAQNQGCEGTRLVPGTRHGELCHAGPPAGAAKISCVRGKALLAVALLAAGCGGEENLAATGPGAAQVRFIENLYGGRFERAWGELHPAHQRVVSRRLFARCTRQTIATGELESIEVLDIFDDEIAIPRIRDRTAKAVRVRVASFAGDSFTIVNHEVKVGERWRWVLNASSIRAYERGRCPT
jgi:hypothetical protein